MPSRTYLIAGLAALAVLVGAGVYFYSGNSGSTIAAASAGAGCKPTGTFKLTDRAGNTLLTVSIDDLVQRRLGVPI